MKLLHIDSSILGDNSVSRQVSAAIVARLRKADPSLQVVTNDLAAKPLPHLSGAYLAGANAGGTLNTALQRDFAESAQAMDEFLAADVVVIGAPMYNFTVPTQLKAWIDRILIAGKTFKYGPNGAEGLAGGKTVYIAVSRGGLYAEGTPNAAAEHLETYLRTVFGFIGIHDPHFVIAEGIAFGPAQRQAALSGALAEVEARRAA